MADDSTIQIADQKGEVKSEKKSSSRDPFSMVVVLDNRDSSKFSITKTPWNPDSNNDVSSWNEEDDKILIEESDMTELTKNQSRLSGGYVKSDSGESISIRTKQETRNAKPFISYSSDDNSGDIKFDHEELEFLTRPLLNDLGQNSKRNQMVDLTKDIIGTCLDSSSHKIDAMENLKSRHEAFVLKKVESENFTLDEINNLIKEAKDKKDKLQKEIVGHCKDIRESRIQINQLCQRDLRNEIETIKNQRQKMGIQVDDELIISENCISNFKMNKSKLNPNDKVTSLVRVLYLREALTKSEKNKEKLVQEMKKINKDFDMMMNALDTLRKTEIQHLLTQARKTLSFNFQAESLETEVAKLQSGIRMVLDFSEKALTRWKETGDLRDLAKTLFQSIYQRKVELESEVDQDVLKDFGPNLAMTNTPEKMSFKFDVSKLKFDDVYMEVSNNMKRLQDCINHFQAAHPRLVTQIASSKESQV